MKRLRLLMAVIVLALFTACAGVRPAPPEVQLSGLEISDMSLTHANFLANLRLFNPNNTGLNVRGMLFSLYLNDIRIANGQSAKAFAIPAEAYGDAAVRLSTSYLNLLQLSRSLQGQKETTYRLKGEVHVGGWGLLTSTIPIEREGTLSLSGALDQLLPAPTQ